MLGLIAADALNMLLRVAYCLVFIRGHFSLPTATPAPASVSKGEGRARGGGGGGSFTLRSLAPSGGALASAALATACAAASSAAFMGGDGGQPLEWLAAALPAAVRPAYRRHTLLANAGCHTAVGIMLLALLASSAYSSERGSVREFMALRQAPDAACAAGAGKEKMQQAPLPVRVRHTRLVCSKQE